MKKIFVFGSILVLALLLTSCVLFQKPLVLSYTGPADGLELVGPNNIKLTWESSIEKFGSLQILVGREKGVVTEILNLV